MRVQRAASQPARMHLHFKGVRLALEPVLIPSSLTPFCIQTCAPTHPTTSRSVLGISKTLGRHLESCTLLRKQV